MGSIGDRGVAGKRRESSEMKDTQAVNATPDTAPPKPPSAFIEGPAADAIPIELRQAAVWLVWAWRLVEDDWTKPPINPKTGDLIDATDSTNWMAFDDAQRLAHQHGDGIGIALGPEKQRLGIAGVDLDKCIDDQGEVSPAAQQTVKALDSYTERTPSGHGLRVLVWATKPGTKCKNTKRKIEIYEKDRYFTVTGRHVDGTPTTIEKRQAELEALYAELWPAETPKAKVEAKGLKLKAQGPDSRGPAELADDELLELARNAKNGAKFSALFDRGDTSSHNGDDSAADMALMNMLAYLTGKDASRMESLFSRSALGQRGKWKDRADYRKMTIDKAIADCRKTYHASTGTRPANNGKPQAGGSVQVLDGKPRSWALTDMGNAERLVYRHGLKLRFCHPWKKWLHWDGRRWAVDRTAEIDRLARETVRHILDEAIATSDKDEYKRIIAWAQTSEFAKPIAAMIHLAASEAGIPILPDGLNRDPWLLNVQNGTIDLRNGELREHRREDWNTSLAPVNFDSSAVCPVWEKTLNRILAGNQKLIRFWQQLCGIALTGDVSEQILPILYGSGANGKTTILKVLLDLLGPDYAIEAPPGLLVVKRGETHPTDRATLFQKRLVVDMESAEGARLNENLVKQLTGGDQISARRMREDFWTFDPTHKVMMGTNHRPEIQETKNAIWRRIKLVPFTVVIREEDQDKKLPQKLRREFPGILEWCIQGCLDWKENGLVVPDEVLVATDEYRKEQNVLLEFIASECVLSPGNDQITGKASELYRQYRDFTEPCGETPIPQKRFGQGLEELGAVRYSNNGTCYRGIGLRPAAKKPFTART